MKVVFSVDERYMLRLFLLHDRKSSTDRRIVALQNYAWEYSEALYNIVIGRSRSSDLAETNLKETASFLAHLQEQELFRAFSAETKKYKKQCEGEWQKTYPRTLSFMREITGFSFDDTFRIYIVHPLLRQGSYWGEKKIVWGCHERWPHYTSVYIWHEILHAYLGHDDSAHALIQLIADNELRVRLNGGAYPPFEGHPDLFPRMRRILPHWRAYLETDRKAEFFRFASENNGGWQDHFVLVLFHQLSHQTGV